MSKHQLQAAYVLHTRAYRNTSLLIELFTAEQGRVSVVARGAKRPKSPWRGLLQPFVPILVGWVGRGDLKTLCTAEADGVAVHLQGMTLWCGLYLNELLMRVLHGHDPASQIFELYHQAIQQLAAVNDNTAEQKILRHFEKQLLRELGYDLQIEADMRTGELIKADEYYHYMPEHGLEWVPSAAVNSQAIFSGKSLLAIAQDDFSDSDALRDAKRLLRLALLPLLGNKALNTIKMFV